MFKKITKIRNDAQEAAGRHRMRVPYVRVWRAVARIWQGSIYCGVEAWRLQI